jgi:hypothetical protein
VLILLLKKSIDHKISKFCQNFYTFWYDKILNFDLVAINELKPTVLSALNSEINDKLLTAVKSFSEDDEKRCSMLINSTNNLSLKLDEFNQLQKENTIISAQSVVNSLDDILSKSSELNNIFDKTNAELNDLLPNLIKISNKKKLDINAINQNAALLYDLKQSFSSYKSKALSLELTHLEKVTSSLENDIDRTFTSIDATITKNTENLLVAYEKFFAICETFNNAIANNYEVGTVNALKSLSNNFSLEIEKIFIQNKELEAALKRTSDVTKQPYGSAPLERSESYEEIKQEKIDNAKSTKIHEELTMGTLFKISINNHEMGMSFPLSTLIKMIKNNEITDEYNICKIEGNKWVPIYTIKELKDALDMAKKQVVTNEWQIGGG